MGRYDFGNRPPWDGVIWGINPSIPRYFIFQALVCTFQALVCTFQALVCTFQALVYTYQALEYKIM